MGEYTINWNRAIHVNRDIDETLVSELAPQILRLKQESDEHITVAIDSAGGSVSAMRALAGILDSPTPQGKKARYITVATNRAYSAAASLLALGSYAIALPDARILYHDVRYEALPDITAERAREAVRLLRRDNDALALDLAFHITPRLVLSYNQLKKFFAEHKRTYERRFTALKRVSEAARTDGLGSTFDMAGFAMTLYGKTSLQADPVVAEAISRLVNWMELQRLEAEIEAKRARQKRRHDVLSGVCELYSALARAQKTDARQVVPQKLQDRSALYRNIKLMTELIARAAASDPRWDIDEDNLDSLQREFKFFKEMDTSIHNRRTSSFNETFGGLVYGDKVQAALKAARGKDREQMFSALQPQAKLFWSFAVLLCRSLLNGDHQITPRDAQILGLVDEVLGGGPFKSIGELHRARQPSKAKRRKQQPKSQVPSAAQ